MKKLALAFGAVLALASCSDVDDKIGTDTSLLLKTVTQDGNSMTIIYNGNKIVNLGGATYTYTGDLITTEMSTGSSTGVITGNYIIQTDYIYDGNGRLISETESDDSQTAGTMVPESKTDFTYNTDGTITAQSFNLYNGTLIPGRTLVSTFANGNVVKEELSFPGGGSSSCVTLYEYDNKINPYHNITGYGKLLDYDSASSKNNVTKITVTSGSGNNTETNVMTFVYTYNDKGYPLTMQQTQILTSSPGSTPGTTYVSNYKYSY